MMTHRREIPRARARLAMLLLAAGLLLGGGAPAWAQDAPAAEQLPSPAQDAPAPAVEPGQSPVQYGAVPVAEPAPMPQPDELPLPPGALPESHHEEGEHESKSRISDEVLGILPEPERPKLLVETNDHFLSPGFLSEGYELGTGAVWRPSLWIFGTNRFTVQHYDDHSTTNSDEVVDRLDLFAQLNLTASERILFSVRPFDHEVDNVRRYSSYELNAAGGGPGIDGYNFYPQTLFFEGDLAEIFPCLDPFSTKATSYYISVGRQPVSIEEGMFINADILDAVSVTRNTISGCGVLNERLTFMYAWDRVHRNDDLTFYLDDTKAQMFAMFSETDLKVSTVDLDLAYVSSTDPGTQDGIYFGASATQRIHFPWETINTTFRILGSYPTEHETLATGKGVLLFSEMSITPHGTQNVLYCTTFGALGNCTSPARGVETGGPLSPQAGLLFARPQIGQFGSDLSTLADDVVGGAIGYEILCDGIRKQLTFEIGGRQSTDGSHTAAAGAGMLYQQAFGQHWIFLLKGAFSKQEGMNMATGARMEVMTKF